MRVAVVMGGYGPEREVSLVSGQGVLAALSSLGYDAVSLDFDDNFVSALRALRPRVVFNALHGNGGEDGTIQGVLEWMRLPYTGSDVRACAVSMDKHLTKKLMAAQGLPTPAWETFNLDGSLTPPLPATLTLPLVVKPRTEGSSNGVHIVRTLAEWSAAMSDHIATKTSGVLVEEYVSGTEFTCGVLFEEALPVIEIIPQDTFYSFAAKYALGGSKHFVPARIENDLAKLLQTQALCMHRLIGLRDYSRTDFIVTTEGRPYILEINALPGLTPTSLFPEECAAVGIPFQALIDRLVSAALQRGCELRV